MRTPAQRFKRRLEALNRRADFLTERIETRALGTDSFDKQELGAIVWAINIIEDNPDLALSAIKYEPPKEKRGGDE